MCGITGIIGTKTNERSVRVMMDRIAHRGPDGQGVWSTEGVCFGHLRLSIIDVTDKAAQPMRCAVTGNVLVFNGEIYNYLELKEELTHKYNFRTNSDTEVILAGYAVWGPAFLEKLRGMFTIALFDASINKVLIARDRIGIKPLYYTYVNNEFCFASEIKALLALAGTPPSPNLMKVLAFQSFRHLDTDNDTCFKGVQQLSPGTYVYIDANGRMEPQQIFWRFPEERGGRTFGAGAVEEFREKLFETMRLHLRSDVAIGSFLSGGLDSSAVACMAAQLLGDSYKLELFSYRLRNNATEENELIPIVQEKIRGVNNDLYTDGEDFLNKIEDVIYHHDEPLPDATMFIHYELCRLANQRKIKVLLSGSGGDELLGGYQSHTYAQFGSLLKSLKLREYGRRLRNFRTSKYESKAHIASRSFQEASPFALRNMQKRFVAKKQMEYWVNEIDTSAVNFYTSTNNDPWMANFLNYYKSWTAPPYLHYEDRNSMAFGVEVRVPFFDHSLIEYVMQFDPGSIVSDISKNPLRLAMKNIVPSQVLSERSKHGFPAPLSVYTRLQPAKTKSFFLDHVKTTPFYDMEKAEKLCNTYLSASNEKLSNDFWRILSVSVWYNKFFK